MRVQFLVGQHVHEAFKRDGPFRIVLRDEAGDERGKILAEQLRGFVASSRGGSHEDNAAKMLLAVVTDVVADDEASVRPPGQHRLV